MEANQKVREYIARVLDSRADRANNNDGDGDKVGEIMWHQPQRGMLHYNAIHIVAISASDDYAQYATKKLEPAYAITSLPVHGIGQSRVAAAANSNDASNDSDSPDLGDPQNGKRKRRFDSFGKEQSHVAEYEEEEGYSPERIRANLMKRFKTDKLPSRNEILRENNATETEVILFFTNKLCCAIACDWATFDDVDATQAFEELGSNAKSRFVHAKKQLDMLMKDRSEYQAVYLTEVPQPWGAVEPGAADSEDDAADVEVMRFTDLSEREGMQEDAVHYADEEAKRETARRTIVEGGVGVVGGDVGEGKRDTMAAMLYKADFYAYSESALVVAAHCLDRGAITSYAVNFAEQHFSAKLRRAAGTGNWKLQDVFDHSFLVLLFNPSGCDAYIGYRATLMSKTQLQRLLSTTKGVPFDTKLTGPTTMPDLSVDSICLDVDGRDTPHRLRSNANHSPVRLLSNREAPKGCLAAE